MSQQPSLRLGARWRFRPCHGGLARRAPLLACAAALVLWAPTLGAQTSWEPAGAASPAWARADSLLQAGDPEGAFAALAAHLVTEPDDFEARWRAVGIAVALSVLGDTHVARRGWALEADAHGRELLRVRPNDPEALAWAAAARGRHALNEEGLRDPARLAKETWALTESLLSVRPDHPLGNHVRGKLCQQVAGLPRAARLFGRVFLGGTLVGQGTWERAEEHHLRAVRGDPGMVYFYLDLGETYVAQGAAEAASRVYRAGLAVPARHPLDEGFKRLMSQRLSALGGQPGASLR